MKIIENQQFDEERALYGSNQLLVKNCSFDGPADGESAFKESSQIKVKNCFFNLRYPFWHNNGLSISHSEMTANCRAALWYSNDVVVTDSKLHGIKAFRECGNVNIQNCDIISPEFGWSVQKICMEDTTAVSDYFMMRSEELTFRRVQFQGKYSFQYIKNAVFEDCVFDTKDAFWHGENITIRNSIIKGEYLAWYSNGLTLINCKIIGTQPFCYCRNLKLISCEMIGADLAFENSQADATIITKVDSIKNPLSGRITVPDLGELILDDARAKGEIIVTNQNKTDFSEIWENPEMIGGQKWQYSKQQAERR